MTYASELIAMSRKPQTVVIITLDYCDRTFGVAPCTATGEECYNTRGTCKDKPNYLNTSGKTYKFCRQGSVQPFPGENIRPYLLKDPTYLSTEIDAKHALTINARVTMEFYDELDNDIGIDPYVSSRAIYPNAPGTFWKKLFARNPHYIGRTVTIKKGFYGLTEANYQSQKYIIDQVDISQDGKIKIICKDPLKRADRVDIPAATSGKVTDNPLTAGATTINCDDTTDYTSSGYLRIDDETIQYTGKTPTTFTGCTRGVDIGDLVTTGAQHNQDEKIQQCYVQINTNVADVILDIDENFVGIDSGDIDTPGFTTEKNNWLSAFNFTGIISKPTKASKILKELLEQSNSNQWWSEEEQEVKFKVFAPLSPTEETSFSTLTDSDYIKNIKVDNNEESRLSRIEIYYNRDQFGDIDDTENYKSGLVSYNSDAESANEYNEKAIKTIYSRWIYESGTIIVAAIASRYRRRFLNPAKIVTIILELKDSSIKTGDIIKITSSAILSTDGNELSAHPYQVIKKQQKTLGTFDYKTLDTSWQKRYGFIAPSGQPDWDSASEDEQKYAYIGDTNNQLGTAKVDGFYIY